VANRLLRDVESGRPINPQCSTCIERPFGTAGLSADNSQHGDGFV